MKGFLISRFRPVTLIEPELPVRITVEAEEVVMHALLTKVIDP
jgi:hypothetical protein